MNTRTDIIKLDGESNYLSQARSSDTMLASYPRSGNTWMRYMLYLLHPGLDDEQRNTRTIHEVIPNLDQDPSYEACPSPRVIKTHTLRDPSYLRAIYLLRDPRDSIASYYRFWQKEGDFKGSFIDFLRTPPFQNVHGSWGDHIASWTDPNMPETCIIKYEELRKTPVSEVRRAVQFLNWDLSDSIIEAAVKEADIESMRKKEKAGKFLAHVGAGVAGTWKDLFQSESEVQWFLASCGESLSRFGYEEQVTGNAPLNDGDADGERK